MGVTPARTLARHVLTEVRRRGAYIERALSSVLERGGYCPDDIGYGTRLAHLSVGTYHAVAAVLARYLKDPAGIEPTAHDALVVAATELIYLGAPDHVVDQGVELMRSVDEAYTGLANAVLRRIVADRDSIRAESEALSFGFPDWLAEQLQREYGDHVAGDVMRVSNEQAPVFGYVLSVAPADWCQQLLEAGAVIIPLGGPSMRIEDLHAIRTHPLIASRAILITDIAAQAALSLAPIGPRMLEVGCGRGTKTILWADRARRAYQAGSTIVGIDNNEAKVARARLDADRLGFAEIEYLVADATDLQGLDELFDVVFVDAPCSGLGTLRRHSDKRMTLRPTDIDDLAELAFRLLESASRKVAQSGTLLYATCTMSLRENEAVVERFASSEAGRRFEIDRIGAHELSDHLLVTITAQGFVQMLPRSGGGDGHFIARMKRD